jgi:hypothetical protein
MDPHLFERFVGSILSDFFQCEVRWVGRSGDDGIDLLAIISDQPTMVQVKRRATSAASEGVDVVKLIFASSFGKRARRGMVVTTAKRFSRAAQKWATSEALRDANFQMQLIDFHSLASMVEAVANSQELEPWQQAQRSFRRTRTNLGMISIDPGVISSCKAVLLAEADVIFWKRGTVKSAALFDNSDLESVTFFDNVMLTADDIGSSWTFMDLLKSISVQGDRRPSSDLRDIEILTNNPEWRKIVIRWARLYPDLVKGFDLNL